MNKNLKFYRRENIKTHRNSPRLKVFLFLIVMLISISYISALDFDNFKSIKETKGKAGYNDIEIRNTFGLGRPLWKGTLDENTHECGQNCYAIQTIELLEEGSLIDEVIFERMFEDGSRELSNIRSSKVLIKTGEQPYEADDYKQVCEEKYNAINGTTYQDCKQVKTGTHTEYTPEWTEYVLGTDMPKGIYEVKLEGEKRPDWSYDWIYKTQGSTLSEWAQWASLTSFLNYRFENNYLDEDGNTTWGVEKEFVIGKVGTGLFLNQSFSTINNTINGSGAVIDFGVNWTLTFWLKPQVNWSSSIGKNDLFDTNGVDELQLFYNVNAVNSGNLSCHRRGQTYATYKVNFTEDTWYHLTCKYNGSNTILYINGTEVSISAPMTGYATGSALTAIRGSTLNALGNYTIDELKFWQYSLDNETILEIYNTESRDSTILLNSPANNYVSPTNEVTFNATAIVVGGATLTNMSLWHNGTGTWHRNETLIKTGTTNESIFTKSFTDEQSVLWRIEACDSDGDCEFSGNRTVFIDTSTPVITLNNPATTENIGYYNQNQTLNWSIVDTNLASVWWDYNGTNTTLYGAINTSSFALQPLLYSGILWANDSVGNVASLSRTWSYNVFVNNINYSTSTLATSNENFNINLSYNSSNWISASANLIYNGSKYSLIKTATTNNLIFNNTILVSNPSILTNYSFYFNVSLTNATSTYYILTGNYLQSVIPLELINITSLACSAGYSLAFNFTSLIESNLTYLNFSSVDYILTYGSSGNNTALTSSDSFTNIPRFNICINSSSSYYIGYGEIQYEINGYSPRRFYIFDNTRIVNTTIENNLYSLEDADSTVFQVTATDTSLIPYEGYYITLLRWYPALNEYKIVDMGKTDQAGKTVIHVKVNDVDYRLGLYTPEGSLVKLLEPIRMVCQTTPCVYTIIVDLTEIDLTTFLNIESELSFNPTTSIFTYIFNDPSQDTTLMNLTVWRDTPDQGSLIVCSTSTNSFTGVLVCDVSAVSGQLRAEVYRSASPPILIAQLLKSVRDSLVDVVGGKTISLFIGLILVITMSLMGLISPPLVIILSLVALIPLIILGGITYSVFMIIGAIGGIVLHFLRRIT